MVHAEKQKAITTNNNVSIPISSSDDTDSLVSTLNGDSVDGSTTTGITNDKTKTKTNNNGRDAWSDLGVQNSEEENENNIGIFVLVKFIIYFA